MRNQPLQTIFYTLWFYEQIFLFTGLVNLVLQILTIYFHPFTLIHFIFLILNLMLIEVSLTNEFHFDK